MKLRFAHEAINEFAEGNFSVRNDGQPFDAIGDLAAELLKKKTFVDGEGMVAVFEPALATDNGQLTVDNAGAEESESGFPEEFPAVEQLAAAGLSYEDVRLLNREQLIDIKGIGGKTADAILAITQPDDAAEPQG